MIGLQIDNGVVVNKAVFARKRDILKMGFIPAPRGDIGIGWLQHPDTGEFAPPPQPEPDPLTEEQMAHRERAWRDRELSLADVTINKLQDQRKSATAWRQYRIELRDWPEQENFPDPQHRPQRPAG